MQTKKRARGGGPSYTVSLYTFTNPKSHLCTGFLTYNMEGPTPIQPYEPAP